MEYEYLGYVISDDKERLDDEYLVNTLKKTYWAEKRSREQLLKSFETSICLGLYDGEKQIGFSRMVTDYATFTWLSDVILDENYRGKGLGKWIVDTALSYPDVQGTLFMLLTRDAKGLYKKCGFVEREALIKRPVV